MREKINRREGNKTQENGRGMQENRREMGRKEKRRMKEKCKKEDKYRARGIKKREIER